MRKTLIYLAILVILPCFVLTVLLIDTSADVQVSSSEQVDKADTVSILLEQARTIFRERSDPHQVSISPLQANSLAGFLQRARGQAHVDIEFAEDLATLKASYRISQIPKSLYLNIEVAVSSAPGVLIEQVKIGSVSLPGSWALSVVEYLVNRRTQSDVASQAKEWVKNVDISPQRILLDLAPSESLVQALKQVQGPPDDAQTALLKQQIVHYIRFLDTLPLSKQSQGKTSLAYYLSNVMQEASRVTQDDAAMQNEAAIMALAIYAGNYRFSRLVGSLSIAVADMPTTSSPSVLATREDLSLHFIYSAAIKLLSEQGFSIAVGEFKELMDRGAGGSGYSFTDLAADLAGAHFAALAVDPLYAKHIQDILSQAPQESLFLPNLLGLEEGLDAKAFTDKYQAVDSPAYQQTLELINQRIANLPISQL